MRDDLGQRLLNLMLNVEALAQVKMRERKLWVQRYGLVQLRIGLIELSLLEIQATEVGA